MKTFKKIVCTILVVLMLLTSAPMQGFVGMDIDIDLPDWFGGKAKAVGVSGYNAVAAVEWAKAHVYDTWSCLYGQGYWEPGTGDCANFVSQCIYMGGVDQSDAWNHSGYKAHYSTGSNGSWIRASQLHDFVVSIGGVDIQNPSVSQIEVGDLIFYKQNPGTSGFSHCAIVIDVSGGVVTVAAHTTNEVCYTDTNWHLGFSNEGTHLVKMYGATCTEQVVRSFDVYTAGNNAVVYSDPSTGSTRRFEFFSGEYAHIYETKTVNGVVWGYTCGYGANFYYGWVKLNALNYKCHVSTGPVDHIMGDWYVKVQPTCIAVGVEERVCSRCGYTEQRNMSLGGNHKNIVEATCLSPSYCTACGATISDALGHDWENWSAVVEATCLTGGEEKRSCNRCGITENRTVNPLGHNHQPVVDIPTCVTDGTSTFECTRCGDSYIEESEWSAWTDEYSEQYFIDNLIPESMYESRTEYRYRDKKYTTEDSTSASLSKSGWNWYKSEHTGYTDYASCEETWQDTVINSDELTYVHTRQAIASYNYKTVYNYYRYATVDEDRGGTGQWWADSTYKYYRTYKFDSPLTDTDWFENNTRYKWWHGDTYTGVYASDPYTTQEVVSTNYKTQYCAHKRQKNYTNYFWQWDAWSDWSEIEYTQTDERAVETRTVYRVKQAALGHIWDDGKIVSPTCHEDGYTEYTCNRCGVSIKENIIPALGDLWGEKYLISEEGVTPKVYRQDCIRGCGCNCGCYKTFIEECEYEVTGVTEATCTEKGYTTYTCVLHGETYDSDYVDALGHKEDGQWFVTKAPTCTESGESICKCVRHDDGVTCDKTYTRSIDAVGHSLVKTAAVAVTCEQDGNSEYYQCKICNKYFADSQAKTEIEEASWIITATGHNGKNVSGEEIWITELEASCGLTGRECLYCQNEWCDYVYECENHTSHHYLIDEREIAEIIPDYAIVEHKDSTCIELGYDIWSCLNCYGTENEHGWTEIINYKFHDWSEPVVVYATCTDGGTETITCNYCKREETYGTEDAIGHALSPLDEGYENSDDKMELVSSVANVCGDGSVDTYQCTHIDKNTSARCTYTVTIGEAKEHSLGDYIITLEPTCTEEGYKHKECTNEDCGYRTADETIPSIGHDWNLDKTIEPTCETQGYEHYICNNDSSHEYDDYNKSMLGHEADNNWVVTKAPTCAEKGEEQCKCVRFDDGVTCSKTYTREIDIDPDAHDWDNGVIDPSSTCNTHGTKTYTCQNDNSHKKTESVELNPDNHVGETYIKDNKKETCTEDGYTGDKYCSDCDALIEEGSDIPKLGHDMGKWNDNNNATHTRECQRANSCTYSETENCSFGEWKVIKEATCTEKGSKERACTVCGYKETAEIELKGHNPGETVIENKVEPECEVKGSYDEVVYCTECPKELSREKKEIPAIDHDWGEWKVSKDATIDAKGEEKRICKRDSSHIETRETDKLIAYTAYFIRANENGEFEYNGKKYDLVDTVRFAEGTTAIVNPDVPEEEGFIGYWEDYTLSDKNIYIEAIYELKSSDNQSDLKSDKDVVYKDGVATITLSAFAETLNAKVPMGATPVDIILVLDQSSSMTSYKIGKETRLAVLKRVAKDFIATVYDSAVENEVDHRVALVSFSGTKDNCKGTGLIGVDGKIKTFKNLKDSDYANAFIGVNGNLDNLKNGIESLIGISGTSSDYGLQMARQILANNQDGREKLVLFITDGEPGDPGRNMGAFNYTVANDAIDYANQIKNDYGTTIYSIGVAAGANPDDETNKINKFLHYVSSNYPDAKSMDDKGAAATMKNYFLSAEDADEIAKMFESIVSRQIVNTISFTKVNFYDTVSEYFTFTTENENALRESVKTEYGVSDSDIVIERNVDGTTTVRINNLVPKAVFDDNNVQTGYGATVKFDVTANEKTLEGGTFVTNTENAGIENGGKTVIEFKVPDGEPISSGRAIVEFRIGDEVYAIREVNIGDKVVVPETEVADWVVTDGTTITSDYTVFNTEYTSETRTIRWIIDGAVKEETYHIGEIIFAPDFVAPEGMLFKGWNAKVPYRMPDYDLEFTAVFEEHKHNYKQSDKAGECTTAVVYTYTCDCGDSYTETETYGTHSFTANVQLVNDESVATMICSVCGKADSKVINYKAQYEKNSWWNTSTKVVDLTLYDNVGITVQPDGYIYVKLYGESDVLSNAKTGKLIINRVNEDGSEDNIPYLSNSSVNNAGYYVDGNYIILKLDHFSYYAIMLPEDAANVPTYGEIECAFNGHSYTSKVTAPTCTAKGFTTYTCSSCGDVYTDAETIALGHNMSGYVVTKQPTCTEKGSERSTCTRCTHSVERSIAEKEHSYQNGVCTSCGKSKVENCSHLCHKGGFMGFIWKIVRFFWKLFKMNPVCDCGAKHY